MTDMKGVDNQSPRDDQGEQAIKSLESFLNWQMEKCAAPEDFWVLMTFVAVTCYNDALQPRT